MLEMNSVNFKKERDLGSIITDAFKFIRENWKAYFGTIIRVAGPAFILAILAIGFYMVSIGGLLSEVTGSIETGIDSGTNFMVMGGSILIAIIAGIVFYVLLQMSSLYYIKSYVKNNGVVNREEISQNIKQNFWKFFGLVFLTLVIVIFGVMLCFLPGIYIGVVLSLGASIMVFEGKGIRDTISYCFKLIKERWWETFGVLLVVGLLVGILGQIFSVPSMIYMFVKAFTSASNEDPAAMLSIFSDPIYLGLTVLSYAGQFILSSITMITNVLIYFDLNEQKNLTGTIDLIDNIGE